MADDLDDMDEEDGDPLGDVPDLDVSLGPAKGGKKKVIIIAALVLMVVLGGGGTGLYFTGMLDTLIEGQAINGEEAEAEAEPQGSRTASIDLPGPPIFYEMPSMLVDLKSGRCKAPFLKVTPIVEISSSDEDRMKEFEAETRDRIQEFIREHHREHLIGKAG
ncbi:MAG: hypothetical protein V3R66_06210, partial [Rhodospirillales bacterium]